LTQNGPTMSTHCRKRMGNRTLERLDLEELVTTLRRQGLEGEQALAWLKTHGKEVFPRNDLRRLLKIFESQTPLRSIWRGRQICQPALST
jgi:hypothetical protein